MEERRTVIPASVSLSVPDLVRWGGDGWRNCFPFCCDSGLWTFSGRVALRAGLQRLRLRPGSVVLVPSYFHGCEIDTLLYAGLKLRFYRIDEDLQADLEHVEKCLDSEVSALYIIHYFGLPQRLRYLQEFCGKKGIALIEDCAHALFSRDGEVWLGSCSDAAFFSIYKTVPIPHGGFLVTKAPAPGDDLLLEPPHLRSTLFQTAELVGQHMKEFRARWLTDCVRAVTRPARRAIVASTILAGSVALDRRLLKYRASGLALHLMKLVEPERIVERRRRNFVHLHSILSGIAPSPIRSLPAGACPLFYPILVEDKIQAQTELMRRGIDSVNFWSQHHPACPERLAREVAPWRRHILELPIHQQLDVEDVERMAKTVFLLLRTGTLIGGPRRARRPDASSKRLNDSNRPP